MKRYSRFAPALAAGPIFGLLLYAGLHAADPDVERDNPWVLHFRAAGCETHLYRTSTRINEMITIVDWQGKLADAKYEGARLLSLDVDRVPIQIVELSREEVAKELSALKAEKRYFKIAVEGRHVCIIRPVNFQAVAAEPANRVISLFKEGAKKIP